MPIFVQTIDENLGKIITVDKSKVFFDQRNDEWTFVWKIANCWGAKADDANIKQRVSRDEWLCQNSSNSSSIPNQILKRLVYDTKTRR